MESGPKGSAFRLHSELQPKRAAERQEKSEEQPKLELHLGSFFSTTLRFEVRLFLESGSKETSNQYCRKRGAFRVEVLRRFVESHAFDADAILGPLELNLKVSKVLRCL